MNALTATAKVLIRGLKAFLLNVTYGVWWCKLVLFGHAMCVSMFITSTPVGLGGHDIHLLVLVTRRMSTYGSQVGVLHNNWGRFFLYSSLYGRFVFLAISILFFQVGCPYAGSLPCY